MRAPQRIYLDANIVIYIVENTPNAPQVRAYLQGQAQSVLCSSNLAVMECLVRPLRQGNQPLQQRFLGFFQSLEIIPARRAIFVCAAKIRASTRLRTPDALHLAFANYRQCDVFLTGDAQIAQQWQQWTGRYAYPSNVVVL